MGARDSTAAAGPEGTPRLRTPRVYLERALLLAAAPDGYCLVDQSGEDEGRTQEKGKGGILPKICYMVTKYTVGFYDVTH